MGLQDHGAGARSWSAGAPLWRSLSRHLARCRRARGKYGFEKNASLQPCGGASVAGYRVQHRADRRRAISEGSPCNVTSTSSRCHVVPGLQRGAFTRCAKHAPNLSHQRRIVFVTDDNAEAESLRISFSNVIVVMESRGEHESPDCY